MSLRTPRFTYVALLFGATVLTASLFSGVVAVANADSRADSRTEMKLSQQDQRRASNDPCAR